MQPRTISAEPDTSLLETSVTALGVTSDSHHIKIEARPRLVGTPSGWAMRLVFFASDLLALAIGSLVAVLSVNGMASTPWLQVNDVAWKGLWLTAISSIVTSSFLGAYGPVPPRPARLFRGCMIGTLITSVALLAFFSLFKIDATLAIPMVIVAGFFSLFQAAFQRALCRMRFGKRSWWGTRFIVVGDGDHAISAFERMCLEPQWGVRPIGIIAEDLIPSHAIAQVPYLGRPSQIDEIAKKHRVNRGILVAHWFDAEDRVKLITQGTHRIRQWIALPAPVRFPSLWIDSCEVARLPGWAIRRHLAIPSLLTIKRISDFLITVCVSLVLLPLIALIALLVKLSSKGPIFYCHRRIGRDGHTFMAWKFRTMHPDGDRLLKEYLEANPELAEEWEANHKLKSDPRVTLIGRKLRSSSLDELPQLWNVLVGEMSLVGPRPIVSEEIEKYHEAYDLYRKVPPGITGLWQVSGRNNTTYEERVELDTYYVHNWSIWLDFYILACTVKVVLLGEGAY